MLTITRKKVTTSEEALFVPDHWGMFTAHGNRSLRRKAQRLYDEIDEAWRSGEFNYTAYRQAFTKFFKAWRRMHNTRTMGESSDTAVREMVWSFAEKVARSIRYDYFALDAIWEECS